VRRVKRIKSSGDYHGADVDLDEFILLFIVDGTRRARQLAYATSACLEVKAMFSVDDGHIGHRLGEGDVDVAPPPQTHVKVEEQWVGFLVCHVRDRDGPGRAHKLAGATSDAGVCIPVEGWAYLAVYAPSNEAYCLGSDDFMTDTNTESTQVAEFTFSSFKTGLLDAKLGCQLLENGSLWTTSPQQLDQHLPTAEHLFRSSQNFDFVADGIVT
jgi:hypothetical protein